MCVLFFFSSRRRHTRCALVTGVQTCALPISVSNKQEKNWRSRKFCYAAIVSSREHNRLATVMFEPHYPGTLVPEKEESRAHSPADHCPFVKFCSLYVTGERACTPAGISWANRRRCRGCRTHGGESRPCFLSSSRGHDPFLRGKAQRHHCRNLAGRWLVQRERR